MWHLTALDKVTGFQYGYTTTATKEHNGTKFLRITDINEDGRVSWDKVPSCDIDQSHFEKYKLVDGDVLVARIGATTGKSCIIKDSPKAVFGSYLIRMKPNRDMCESDYLFYYTQSSAYWSQINANKEGKLKKGVSASFLSNLLIPLPSVTEQQGIREILRTIDLAIERTDEIIAKTQRLKQGLMQELLTKGMRHEKVRDVSEIETTIPKSWSIRMLEEVAHEVTIGVVNPATPYYTTPDKGVPYFRSQNVRENRLEPTTIFVTKEFNQRHARSILRENDVLTLQTGFIGTSCLVPKLYEGSNCHSLLITRTNLERLLPGFLCQLLNSEVGKRIISRHQTGWGRSHLLLEDFRRLYVPIPSIEEQKMIVDVLASIDATLNADKLEAFRLFRIKEGFMDLLLTGKIRVRAN